MASNRPLILQNIEDWGSCLTMIEDSGLKSRNMNMELISAYLNWKVLRLKKQWNPFQEERRQKSVQPLAFLFQFLEFFNSWRAYCLVWLDPIAVEILKAKIKKKSLRGRLILITFTYSERLEELRIMRFIFSKVKCFFHDTIDSLK